MFGYALCILSVNNQTLIGQYPSGQTGELHSISTRTLGVLRKHEIRVLRKVRYSPGHDKKHFLEF